MAYTIELWVTCGSRRAGGKIRLGATDGTPMRGRLSDVLRSAQKQSTNRPTNQLTLIRQVLHDQVAVRVRPVLQQDHDHRRERVPTAGRHRAHGRLSACGGVQPGQRERGARGTTGHAPGNLDRRELDRRHIHGQLHGRRQGRWRQRQFAPVSPAEPCSKHPRFHTATVSEDFTVARFSIQPEPITS